MSEQQVGLSRLFFLEINMCTTPTTTHWDRKGSYVLGLWFRLQFDISTREIHGNMLGIKLDTRHVNIFTKY